MEEIKASRINGRLDLDEYFSQRGVPNCVDLEELASKGLIEPEISGICDKFWILSSDNNERIALFKVSEANSYADYAELLAEEMAKVMEIKTAHYDLATFNGMNGVISYNFLDEYDSIYHGTDIILDYYDEKIEDSAELLSMYGLTSKDLIDDVCLKLNNLEDIWSIIEHKYKDYNNKSGIVKRVMDGLVDKLIFDVLTNNVDDHSENWGIIDTDSGKYLAPMYDNSRVLGLYKNVVVEKALRQKQDEEPPLYLTVDNSSDKYPAEVLDKFLRISSSEYVDLVKEKISLLQEHVCEIPEMVEARTGVQMSDFLKRYFNESIANNLETASTIVDKYDRKRAK